MKPLFIILIISTLSLSIKAQSNETENNIIFPRTDTVCNYIMTRESQDLLLPDYFEFRNNQRGFVLLRLTIESEKIVKWKIDLFRVLENDSIVRNYSETIDKKTPEDIEALTPIFQNIINKINIKAINPGSIDPNCKIGIKLNMIKN